MSLKIELKWLIVILAMALSATAAQAVIIETVPVGNLGNTDDTTGYGAVDYAYNIGKYEVTAGQYTEFLNAVAGVDAYGLYNSNMWSASGCKIERFAGSGTTVDPYQYRVPDANGINCPVNYVSWGDAARFSNWLHNGQPTGTLTGNPTQDAGLTEDGAYYLNGAITNTALMAVSREVDWKWSIPSEDEWYKAAYHKNNGDTGDYFDYPTSSDSAPINTVETTDPGNNANYWDYDGTGTGGYTIGFPYYTTLVGEFESSESPYDTFDQGGNLREWNEAILYGSSRGLRGGGWSGSSYYLAASTRDYDEYEYENIGFRVASVPEPASITLLLCGLLSLICLRRRK